MANIRTARRSGLVLRGGRNVRQTRWLFVSEVATVLPAANSAVLTNSFNAAALALAPFTIVRYRGVFHAESDQQAASETYALAFGMSVVSEQAVAIGITAVPTPSIDRGSDLWFVYEEIVGVIGIRATDGISGAGGVLKMVDSRAMRKVEEGQDLAVVVENGAITANGSATRTSGRLLIKLH